MRILDRRKTKIVLGAAAFVALLAADPAVAEGGDGKKTDCHKTARRMSSSCRAEVHEEYLETIANCLNVAEEERVDCAADAKEERTEERALCQARREAREDACVLLGEESYDVEPLTDPGLQFVDPDTIGDTTEPNPFVSLEAGHTHVLRAGEDFEETVVVHVTDEIREILGQPCRVVLDVVLLVEEDPPGVFEYEAVEATDDWFAQATNGDVYYCGEVARNFEDGVLRDLDGSFEAGIDFAKSGILIKSAPMVGDAHRQEFFLGEAEDLIEYVDTSADVPAEEGGDNASYPCAGSCLKTSESIPPEPESGEFKYYIEGVGFVLGVALEDGEITGERDELVCSGDSLAILEDPACEIDDVEALKDVLCRLSPGAFCD